MSSRYVIYTYMYIVNYLFMRLENSDAKCLSFLYSSFTCSVFKLVTKKNHEQVIMHMEGKQNFWRGHDYGIYWYLFEYNVLHAIFVISPVYISMMMVPNTEVIYNVAFPWHPSIVQQQEDRDSLFIV